MLAVGYNTGQVILCYIENADILHTVHVGKEVTCLTWASQAIPGGKVWSCDPYLEDNTETYLPKLQPLNKRWGVGYTDIKHSIFSDGLLFLSYFCIAQQCKLVTSLHLWWDMFLMGQKYFLIRLYCNYCIWIDEVHLSIHLFVYSLHFQVWVYITLSKTGDIKWNFSCFFIMMKLDDRCWCHTRKSTRIFYFLCLEN